MFYSPVNNRRRWATVGISILLISAIVIMAPIVTFLYIRFSQETINTTPTVSVIRDTIDNEPTINKYNIIPRKTVDTTTIVHNDTQNVIDDPVGHVRNHVQIVGLRLKSAESQAHKKHSTAEELKATRRSFMDDSVQDNRLIAKPILSRSNKQPIVVIRENQYPNHKSDTSMSANDKEINKGQLINNNGIYQHIMNR